MLACCGQCCGYLALKLLSFRSDDFHNTAMPNLSGRRPKLRWKLRWQLHWRLRLLLQLLVRNVRRERSAELRTGSEWYHRNQTTEHNLKFKAKEATSKHLPINPAVNQRQDRQTNKQTSQPNKQTNQTNKQTQVSKHNKNNKHN